MRESCGFSADLSGAPGRPNSGVASLAVDSAGEIALDRFTGVAVVVDRDGRTTAASAAARPLAMALRDRPDAWSAPPAPRAQTLGAARRTVTLESGETYELEVLPLERGGALIVGREVTLDRNLREALIDSRRRYKDLVECSTDFAWETGRDGRFVFVSPRGALGYSAAELTDRNPLELIHERHHTRTTLPFHSRVPLERAIVWLRTADDLASRLETACRPLFDDEGRWLGARGVCRDVTIAWRRDQALARARRRERLVTRLVNTIRDEVDPERLLARAAEATGQALGVVSCRIYRAAEDGALICAATFGDTVDEAAAARLDETVNSLDRDSDPLETSLDGYSAMAAVARHRRGVNGAVCVLRQAERGAWSDDDRALMAGVAANLGIAIEQIANHEALKRLSGTDELTGLLNRRAFTQALEGRVSNARRTHRPGALLYTDLDDFKLVNDVYGHAAGDKSLVAWANVLKRSVRANDLVARLGGDEFAVWFDEIDDQAAVAKAKAILAQCGGLEPYSGHSKRPLKVSIGIAAFDPATGDDLVSLVRRADEAMYTAKKAGKGSYAIAATWRREDSKEDSS